eukprot:COSAG04_NODE_622_length_11834_cov_56.658969_1_plen_232_part_00
MPHRRQTARPPRPPPAAAPPLSLGGPSRAPPGRPRRGGGLASSWCGSMPTRTPAAVHDMLMNFRASESMLQPARKDALSHFRHRSGHGHRSERTAGVEHRGADERDLPSSRRQPLRRRKLCRRQPKHLLPWRRHRVLVLENAFTARELTLQRWREGGPICLWEPGTWRNGARVSVTSESQIQERRTMRRGVDSKSLRLACTSMCARSGPVSLRSDVRVGGAGATSGDSGGG